MASNNTMYSTAALDVVAVLDDALNQLFPDVRAMKATIKEESKLFEHPLEIGAQIADHRVFLPTEIELAATITNEFYREAYQQVKEVYLRGDLLTVQTKTDSYTDMVMLKMPHEESPDMSDGVTIILFLREAKFVSAVYKDMPVAAKTSAKSKNADTVKRGEQRPTETPEPRKGSVLSKLGVFK